MRNILLFCTLVALLILESNCSEYKTDVKSESTVTQATKSAEADLHVIRKFVLNPEETSTEPIDSMRYTPNTKRILRVIDLFNTIISEADHKKKNMMLAKLKFEFNSPRSKQTTDLHPSEANNKRKNFFIGK
jgi:hypothetical protein